MVDQNSSLNYHAMTLLSMKKNRIFILLLLAAMQFTPEIEWREQPTATLTRVAANGLNGVRVSAPMNPLPPPPPAWYPEATVVSGNTVDVTFALVFTLM